MSAPPSRRCVAQLWRKRWQPPPRPPGRGVLEGGLALGEQLEGVAEGDTVEPLHELDRVARRAAGHAVVEPLRGADDEVGAVVVVVERAAPDEVAAAVLLHLDTARAHQREQVGCLLDALDFLVGYPCHFSCPPSG